MPTGHGCHTTCTRPCLDCEGARKLEPGLPSPGVGSRLGDGHLLLGTSIALNDRNRTTDGRALSSMTGVPSHLHQVHVAVPVLPSHRVIKLLIILPWTSHSIHECIMAAAPLRKPPVVPKIYAPHLTLLRRLSRYKTWLSSNHLSVLCWIHHGVNLAPNQSLETCDPLYRLASAV
jgi:hypothetical protein